MKVESLKRKFMYEGEELSDPNNKLKPEEVLDFYSQGYPEFVNAKVVSKGYEGKYEIYEISSNYADKG